VLFTDDGAVGVERDGSRAEVVTQEVGQGRAFAHGNTLTIRIVVLSQRGAGPLHEVVGVDRGDATEPRAHTMPIATPWRRWLRRSRR